LRTKKTRFPPNRKSSLKQRRRKNLENIKFSFRNAFFSILFFSTAKLARNPKNLRLLLLIDAQSPNRENALEAIGLFTERERHERREAPNTSQLIQINHGTSSQ
jgi:hypothetical protein